MWNTNIEFAVGDIISLKIHGDEVIGRYEGQTDECVFISKPVTIVPSPQGIGMVQSMVSMDMNQKAPLGIRKSAISMETHTKHDLADHYRSSTSHIQVVAPKVLMG